MKLYQLKQLFLGAASVGAVGVGFVVLGPAPEAKAACMPDNKICSTFTAGQSATPTLGQVGGFQFSGTLVPNANITQFRVGFKLDLNTGTFPVNITGISFSGPGISSYNFSSGVSIPSNSSSAIRWTSGFVSLTNPLASVDLSTAKLNFTIPAGLSAAAKLTALVQYSNGTANSGNGDDVLNSNNFITTGVAAPSPVPGPLPVLGAASAFACSRKLRRRIRVSQAS